MAGDVQGGRRKLQGSATHPWQGTATGHREERDEVLVVIIGLDPTWIETTLQRAMALDDTGKTKELMSRRSKGKQRQRRNLAR